MDTIIGKDGVVHGLKPGQGSSYIVQRPLQLMSNLKIGGENTDYKLNPDPDVFVPRVTPSRRTKERSCSKTLLHKKLKLVTGIQADKHLNKGRVLRTFSTFVTVI